METTQQKRKTTDKHDTNEYAIMLSKKCQIKKEYILFGVIYMKFKNKSNSSVVTEVRTVITLGGGYRMGRDTRNFSG